MKLQLRLVIDVKYDMCDGEKQKLIDCLKNIVYDAAAANGCITGSSESCIDEWTARVEVIDNNNKNIVIDTHEV